MKDLPAAAARRAKADQRRYAEAYLPKRGKRLAEPLFMIRFLVRVCGLSLREASQAVRAEMLKDQKQSWEPQGEPVLRDGRKAAEGNRRHSRRRRPGAVLRLDRFPAGRLE